MSTDSTPRNIMTDEMWQQYLAWKQRKTEAAKNNKRKRN